MARGIIAVSWHTEDDEGYLAEMLFNCDVGLSTCLAIQETLPETDRLDGGQRERLLRSLYDIWRFDTFDIGWGSLATNGPEAIARCVTPAERTRVDGWLAAERLDTPFTQDMTSNFRVLLAEHAGLCAERLLAIYREAGRWNDVANRLFAANQVDNAIAVAREHLREPASLLPFATRLAQQDAPRAIQLVEDLAWEVEGKDAGADAAIEGWLAANLGAAGRAAEALALADKCFALSPTIETWRGVRDVARLPDQETDAWSSRRPRMLSTLREQNDLPTVIVAEVEEGDTDAAELALAELRRLRERNPYAVPYQEMQMLESIVGQAIEVMHPDKAIARYRHQAELLIGQRKRDAYRQAAQYLERVKLLLDANARRDEWQSIIDEVRNKHKKLSALRDELDALDLA
jgi:tetratricopeptide (TPR) repeat protein